jgi:hypothetical protein
MLVSVSGFIVSLSDDCLPLFHFGDELCSILATLFKNELCSCCSEVQGLIKVST